MKTYATAKAAKWDVVSVRRSTLQNNKYHAAVLAALWLTFGQSGCSGSKPAELKSSIHTAGSLAAESVLFLDYIGQGRARKQFAETHRLYLVDSIDNASQDLAKLAAVSSETVNQCRRQLVLLRGELLAIHQLQDSPESVEQIRAKMDAIQRALKDTESRL